MANLESMIEKRHPAPGWQVMWEVSNGTGYRREVRYADAIAFGIWPSHGNELHGFEIKRSREDLKKELSDPSKGDAIGKFVDYWWLVLDDIKLCEGIVIPATWGILAPRGQVLKVHRKAPKRKATPIDRSFAAAMIRRVTEHWVPKEVHEAFRNNAKAEVRAELERERKYAKDTAEANFKELLGVVRHFEKLSGIALTTDTQWEVWDDEKHEKVVERQTRPASVWEIERIGPAVKIVAEMRAQLGRRGGDDDLASLIEHEIHKVKQGIEHYRTMIGNREGVVSNLEYMLETERKRQTSGLPLPDGDVSPAAPPDGHDHQGGGIDRGHPGASEQDAGLLLRDQRAEVPPGQ